MIEAFRVGVVGREGTLWDGLDFAFPEGEVWAVTGPPSCGRSLLLKVLRGERKPEAGDVMAEGESVYRGSADARRKFLARSGAVTDAAPPPRTSVGDRFRVAALALGKVPAAELREREAALLAMVGMPAAAGWDMSTLSLSERYRASLAVELFRGPKYLFLDGLLSGAGKEWLEMLGSLFRALAREGKTIVLAERELPPAFPLQVPRDAGKKVGPFRMVRLLPGGDAPR